MVTKPEQRPGESMAEFCSRLINWQQIQHDEAVAEGKVIDRLNSRPKIVAEKPIRRPVTTLHDAAVSNPLLRNLLRGRI